MAENLVEIVVRSKDESAAGFAKTKAGAAEAGGAVDEYAAATDRAAKAEQEFRAAQEEAESAQSRLDELQKSGTASADELAAAHDRVTQATLRSVDAQLRLGDADARVADAERAAGDAAAVQAGKTESSGGRMAAAGAAMKTAALGVAVGLGLAVKSAGDFQQQTTRLVTSAGESASKLGMVQQGILSLSASTNTSTEQLAKGMYLVESAGFHGADGLKVLKAAAEGAQAEGADLGEVSNALTSALNAYGMSSKSATVMTNMMVAAVSAGKMTMQDFAGALSAVLPVAAAAGISFPQVAGAIATMTAQGMSAQQAAQDLANSIRALQSPNSVAAHEMAQLGISSVGVARDLGERGLTGTIGMLAQAVTKHMGPAGVVILSTFNQSRVAAADAQMMLAKLPPAIQGVAKAYLDGSITSKQWTADLKAMPPLTANLAREFAATADRAHGFSDLLRSGSPVAQTFAASLAKMMGGATGLNTALMLTGSHAATFNANVKSVGDSAKAGGGDIQGWAVIQHEANFQLGAAEKAIKAMGISLGTALLPMVNAVIHPLTEFLGLVASNKIASIAFAAIIGGVLAGALGMKLKNALTDLRAGITGFGEGLTSLAAKLGLVTVAEEGATAAGEEMDAAMSLNPAGIIIIALAALAVAFVELWKHFAGFRQFWKAAWHDIQDATDAAREGLVRAGHFIENAVDAVRETFVRVGHDVAAAVDAVVGFVRDHWKLLIAVILGPLGLIIDALATHWAAVKHGFEDAWHFVAGVVTAAAAVIMGILRPFLTAAGAITKTALGVIEAAWRAVWGAIRAYVSTEIDGIKAILGWFGKLADLLRGWWDGAVRAVRTEIDHLIGWVEKIPGRINSALGGLPGMMFRAGVHAIESLINGITSMFSSVGSVMSSLASKVAGFFGLSPAKEGPLSGGGAPEIRGAHFAEAFAAGVAGGTNGVAAAARRLAGAASPGPGGYGAAAGGQAPVSLLLRIEAGRGGSGLDQQFWTWFKNGIRAQGGDPRIVTKKVQFIGG